MNRGHNLKSGRYNMNNYKGFFKVNENNGGVNVCTFFNPETKEEFSKIVCDIDNDRLLEDDEIQILRYLTIDNDAVIAWKHFNNAFVVGDNIEVIKGRKIPKGTILKVFWIGERDTYKTRTLKRQGCRWANETETVAGCYNENGEKVWIKTDYCKYVA